MEVVRSSEISNVLFYTKFQSVPRSLAVIQRLSAPGKVRYEKFHCMYILMYIHIYVSIDMYVHMQVICRFESRLPTKEGNL